MLFSSDKLLAILGIAVALSAYLSGIRLYLIQKIREIPQEDPEKAEKKYEIQKQLGWLTLADAPIVLSAFLLGVKLLWYPLTGISAPDWILSLGLWLFLLAGTLMVIQHFLAWHKTLTELLPIGLLVVIGILIMFALMIWKTLLL
ncbi:MAG: hypothetical protein CME31_20700 [Gimesia sp.]|uniref:Uncharacterized protein n=1 Tax=Gimesia maris TaxID=122 RepID=A0A3D3RBF2_9PLAN|nr:hypothetical protein [Gimesia sp.]HCO26184.1 hypothetical protein [Gimesia maris]|tara:strand:+ start:21178 stop:21612 length:435 start_codon:yes stop_codon:yes gene_type:complete